MKINKKELHDIFQGIANKSEEHFNNLFKQYQKVIYAIAFSILKNEEDSEEVVQNVFTKIYSAKKENLPTKYEASWLYTFTKNETLNFLKKRKKEVSIDEIYDISEEEKQIKCLLGKDAYCRIISKLEPKEQEIVSLKVLSKLSFREIAKLLNMPIGTVQWKYYKSMNTLKLLITNLSIFLITIGMFIVNRTKKGEKNLAESNKGEINGENANTENDRTESLNNTSPDNVKLDDDVSEKHENTITNNETSTTLPVNEINRLTNKDIGILSISGIFLILTIIFSIIFLKHQQKAKKKVSK